MEIGVGSGGHSVHLFLSSSVLQNWLAYKSQCFSLEASTVGAKNWDDSLGISWICKESQCIICWRCFAPVFIQDYAGTWLFDYSSWMWLVLWSVEDKAATPESHWTLFLWSPWICKSNLHNSFTVETLKALAILCAPPLWCLLWVSWIPRILLYVWPNWSLLYLTDIRSLLLKGKYPVHLISNSVNMCFLIINLTGTEIKIYFNVNVICLN